MQSQVATDNLKTVPESVTLSYFAVNYNKRSVNKAKTSKLSSGINFIKSRVFQTEDGRAEVNEYAVPRLLTKACENYKETQEPPTFPLNKAMSDAHKREKMSEGVPEKYDAARLKYVNDNIPRICSNWCSFGQKVETINAYRDLMGAYFGSLTPLKIRVDCYLYHGCDLLFEEAKQESVEVYFNNNVVFDEQICFNLKYC